ncbi:MAG: hypothetical protein AAGI51_10355 [Pseudomonadota bacterium]
MPIPSSLLTYVGSVDVAAAKASPDARPIANRERLLSMVERAQDAPPGPTASQSLANFEPRANQALKSTYASVKAGADLTYPLDSKANAVSAGRNFVTGLQRFADLINKFGGGDLTPGGEYTPWIAEKDQLNDTLKYIEMRNKDNVEVARLQLVVDANLVQNTFDVEGAVFRMEGGQVKINAFDMSYGGELILRSFGGGQVAEYRPDGSLAVDDRV